MDSCTHCSGAGLALKECFMCFSSQAALSLQYKKDLGIRRVLGGIVVHSGRITRCSGGMFHLSSAVKRQCFHSLERIWGEDLGFDLCLIIFTGQVYNLPRFPCYHLIVQHLLSLSKNYHSSCKRAAIGLHQLRGPFLSSHWSVIAYLQLPLQALVQQLLLTVSRLISFGTLALPLMRLLLLFNLAVLE